MIILRTSRTLACIMLLAGAGLPASAQADIYQYVDESGVVNFTNVPSGRRGQPSKVVIEQRRLSPPAARAPLSPVSDRDQRQNIVPSSYLDIINRSCERYGVDPSLVHAIVKVESDFNPFAVSRKGAMGLMQLMPRTAEDLNVKNSFSPDENIQGGVRYLRYLLDRYEGNLSLALAAYNSGETAVQRWGTIPPFKETKEYVKKVLAHYQGSGKVPGARYTIYVGQGPDGTLLLTDNPSNHPGKTLHRKMERSL